MSRRVLLSIVGAALLVSAVPAISRASRPGPTQSSTKKKTSAKRSKRKSKVKAQMAPTPDRVKEIQTALQREGAYNGEPTGKWDTATVEAMRNYQDKKGLSPTGKIDALTLEKLGLGSSTSGKGAPTPAASSTPPPRPAAVPVPAPTPASTSTGSPSDPPVAQ
jgi:peptidoglycan hydrolase-like protein with peptidoglycan-binding domain